MIRFTSYILLALFFALCAYWISSNPGQVLITWQGWEIRFSVAVMVFLTAIYTILIWMTLRLLKWLNIFSFLRDPKRLAAKRAKAEKDLDLAWSAYMLGDDKDAIKHGLRAKSKIGDDHNILRLLASATNRLGESKNPYLEKLKESSESALWVKKIELDKLTEQKDWAAAKPLISSMLETYPNNEFLLRENFFISARLSNWQDAQAALLIAEKHKTFSAQDSKHYKAVIEYCLSLEEKAAGHKPESVKLIKSALKNDPAFAPAAITAAHSYIEQGDSNAAQKVISAAWKHAPNNELAELAEDLYPQESSAESFRRLKKMADSKPHNIESSHLIAKSAINAEQWPVAHEALQSSIDSDRATKTTYQLKALLEKKQKNDTSNAAEYEKKSELATEDHHWKCSSCHTISEHYTPICADCGAFDRINWTTS